MGFPEAVRTCLTNYATFSGRARRPEFWWFFLFVVVCNAILSLIDAWIFDDGDPSDDPDSSPLALIFHLAIIIPMIAAARRRMHDTGRPGWQVFIPVIISSAATIIIFSGGLGMASVPAGDPAIAVGIFTSAIMIIAVLAEIIAIIVLAVWLTRPTQPGPNAYGPEPAR